MPTEEINLKISRLPEYRQWEKKVFGSDDRDSDYVLRPLVDKLISNISGDWEWEWLRRNILVNCFNVTIHKLDGDDPRAREKKRTDNLVTQLHAIQKIRKCARGDELFGTRFMFSCMPENSPGQKIFNFPFSRSGEDASQDFIRIDEIARKVFERYEDLLQRELGDDGICRTREQRFARTLTRRGGLLFPGIQSGRHKYSQMDIQENSFFFHLTFIFRHFIDGRFDLGTSVQQMPEYGKPRYNLTADIFKILFPDRVDDDQQLQNHIRKRVERLAQAGVYICSWEEPQV